MSLAVFISLRAEQDLGLQYQWYLQQACQDIADRYLSAVDATIQELRQRPDIGVRRHFQASELQNIRSMLVRGSFNRHLIFYKADETTLSIERIMHGARDLPRRLLDVPDAG